MIFFLVFVAYPLFRGLYLSFFQYDFLRPEATKFIGLQNYKDLLTAGTVTFNEFWQSMKVTVTFVLLSVPFLILVPFGLALLLNTSVKGANAFRALYFAPWVLSAAVISLIWWWIFQSQGGLLNFYLKQIWAADAALAVDYALCHVDHRHRDGVVDDGLQHDHLPRRAAGDSARVVRGRGRSTAPAAGARSGRSPCPCSSRCSSSSSRSRSSRRSTCSRSP